MNRPNIENYYHEAGGFTFISDESKNKYTKDLEDYCDELEVSFKKMRCQIDNERVVAVGKCLERIDKLGKALDKACARIVEYEVLAGRYMEKEAVKEWIMKDE